MSGTHHFFPATTADYRRLAEQRLPRFLFDYVDGGANDEVTLQRNVADLQAITIRQRVLRDVAQVDTSTTLAGESVSHPVILAPVGMAGLMARRAEVQAVRAANAAGVPFTLSTLGICPLSEVRAAAKQPFWFQLYMMRDRDVVQAMLADAQAAGCSTLVFTVDLALPGLRHRDVRNGIVDQGFKGKLAKAWQVGAHPGWAFDVGLLGRPHHFGSLAKLGTVPSNLNAFRAWLDQQFDASVTWQDLAWLRERWKGRILIKGVLEPDDARAALDSGADGVIVSNHGGRQLDGVASAISALPAVVAAIGARTEVYLDGGVRSGLDVFRAVALGARGVMVGRPWVYAIAGAGQAGLEALLATWKRELEVAMALAGVCRIADLNPGLLALIG
jgi:L-lactate dehydrogenase (cytochrome)